MGDPIRARMQDRTRALREEAPGARPRRLRKIRPEAWLPAAAFPQPEARRRPTDKRAFRNCKAANAIPPAVAAIVPRSWLAPTERRLGGRPCARSQAAHVLGRGA